MISRQMPREVVVRAMHGGAIEAKAGEFLTVTDVKGKQIGDLVAFNLDDHTEWLDMAWTRSTLRRLWLKPGDLLYSNRREPIMEIVEDKVGVHDLLFPPCDPKRYAITWGRPGHRNCLTNLAEALEPYGISIWQVPAPLNVFQNTPVLEDGRLGRSDAPSRAGDYTTFRPLKNVVCAVSSCPGRSCWDLTTPGGWKITDLKLSVRT